MSIKRRFTKEELDKLLRRSEETPIDELANELNMKRKAYIVDPWSRDEESGLRHIDHIACNLAYILENMKGEE